MERATNTKRASIMLAAALLAGSVAPGCVILDPFLVQDDVPATGEICQIVAAWNNELILAPDPYNHGKPNPGIAGRVFLFGPNVDFPRAGDGSITVDLYDASKKGSDGGPVMMERWEFDPISLRKLMRKDTIGWGYTLFLPWGSFRSDVPVWNVVLKVHYLGANGLSHFTENPLTLNRPGGNNTRRSFRQDTRALMPGGVTHPQDPNRPQQTLPPPKPIAGQ